MNSPNKLTIKRKRVEFEHIQIRRRYDLYTTLYVEAKLVNPSLDDFTGLQVYCYKILINNYNFSA